MFLELLFPDTKYFKLLIFYQNICFFTDLLPDDSVDNIDNIFLIQIIKNSNLKHNKKSSDWKILFSLFLSSKKLYRSIEIFVKLSLKIFVCLYRPGSATCYQTLKSQAPQILKHWLVPEFVYTFIFDTGVTRRSTEIQSDFVEFVFLFSK